MHLPMKLLFKNSAHDYMTFKDNVFGYSPEEFNGLYQRTSDTQELQGETDLNESCTQEILQTISGKKVLEVGCGRGYLANLIENAGHDITGCDIIITPKIKKKFPKIKFVQGNIEKLPFADNSFDTVITTHTLEHVQNLRVAVDELRRVAKNELIIVVPRQRPYKYTFSLHTQFFPYEWSLQSGFGYRKGSKIKRLGDWFYHEKIR